MMYNEDGPMYEFIETPLDAVLHLQMPAVDESSTLCPHPKCSSPDVKVSSVTSISKLIWWQCLACGFTFSDGAQDAVEDAVSYIYQVRDWYEHEDARQERWAA